MTRTLRLSADTLTELTPADLAAVIGGDMITHNCNTLDFCEVPTLPVRVCLEK